MSVDGTYQVTTDTPMGRLESKLTLKTDGDNLSGINASAMMGTVEFSGGNVDGNSFTFQMTLSTPMGQMLIPILNRFLNRVGPSQRIEY